MRITRSVLIAGCLLLLLGSSATRAQQKDGAQLTPDAKAPEFQVAAGGANRPLSELCREKPVLLVFGNETLPYFRTTAPILEKAYQKYKNDVHFRIIYTNPGAEPSDSFTKVLNEKENVRSKRANSTDALQSDAKAALKRLKLTAPFMIDSLDNKLAKLYGALPARTCLIGKDQKFIYPGIPNRVGVHPYHLMDSLKEILPKAQVRQLVEKHIMRSRQEPIRIANMAPDFEAERLDELLKNPEGAIRTFRLHDELKKKPVLLLFGSFT